MVRRLALAAVLFALLLGLAWWLPTERVSAGAQTAPTDLVNALDVNGFHVAPPQSQTTARAIIPTATAVSVARAEFGPDAPANAYLGELTYSGMRSGDEASPLVMANRPVYVVQLTNLDLAPLGGGRASGETPTSAFHREMVVFVDAATGETLLATTVR
jgi:hypothetical protein